MMGGRAIVRTCLTLISIGIVWTWGRQGWGEVGGDETQRRRKSDDANPRMHSSVCHFLTFCARRDLRQDLPLGRLPLLEEGRRQSAQNLPSIAGIEIETPMKTSP
jgi:hypothetical protein